MSHNLSRIQGKATSTSAVHNYATNFTYFPDGKIATLRLGNGLYEGASLNSRSQVTELRLGIVAGGSSLLKLNYAYGELQSDGSTVDATKNAGNIAKQTVTFDGLANPFVQTYKYDPLDRITEAKETVSGSQTWIQNWGYDQYGNRTAFTQNILGSTGVSLPSIDAGSNRYAASQGYAFDKNGNVTTDPESGGRSFTFNGDNKQTQVKDSNNYTIGSYSYDGNAKRVKKVTDLETTVFVYDGFDKLVAEYSTATPPSNPTINYTATDQLGSPRVLTDAFGSVVSRRDFMPFGEELYADGTHRKAGDHYSTSGQDDVRQRFTGYQRDSETGLDFAEARYYNNQHGRFTAVDPLLASGKSANPQTFNRYAYGLNRPLVLNDPTGLQAGTVVTGTTYYNPSTDIYQIGPGTGFVKYDGPSWSGVNRAGRYIEMRQNGWTDYGTARPVTSSDQAPEGFVRSIAKLLKNIAIPAADVVNTYHEVMRDPQIQIPLAMTVIGAPLVAEEQILATETRLADDALVVRGGVVTTEQIIAGAEALDTDGNVLGVSVRSAEGLSEAELAAGGVGARPFPNGQIGVTTAGEIRGVGGTIERTPRPDNIYHCDICGPPQPLADVFEQKPNPVKRPQ